MNVPLGRLTQLSFREKSYYDGNGNVGSTDVLRVTYIGYDGDEYHTDFPNGSWHESNKALQFLANYGYGPSDIDGRSETTRDCYEDRILIPLAQKPNGEWGIHQRAMMAAESALKNAEWFGTDDSNEQRERSVNRANDGGGDDDGGSPNPSAKDERENDKDVIMSIADDASDQGVNVAVE